MNTAKIDLADEHIELLCDILKKYLPKNAKVWAFGSRVKATARKYSDLDIVVEIPNAHIELNVFSDLKSALTDSDLPIKVDIVDWNKIDNDFRELIINERIAITY